jgi:MazG family protein
MSDVIAGIDEKLIRRHPHVFGEVEVSGVEQVLHNWEALKRAEREEDGTGKGLLDGVPLSLPALAQAAEIQRRVARVGFDWPALEGVQAKVAEELNELLEAEGEDRRAAEMGDVLFAVVNYARWLEVDPEAALRQAARRFRQSIGEMNGRPEGRQAVERDERRRDGSSVGGGQGRVRASGGSPPGGSVREAERGRQGHRQRR